MKNKIFVGMGTCGLACGAREVYNKICSAVEKLGLDAEVVSTGCVGYCSKEVIVDFQIAGETRISYGEVTPDKAEELVKSVLVDKKYENELLIGRQGSSDNEEINKLTYIYDLPYFKKQKKLVLKNCGFINPDSIDDYINAQGFEGLKKALSMTSKDAVEEVKKSGLRGRGGAGFPTGRKWDFAHAQVSDQKYMVCNADEGDPGAFMDRSIIEGDPFALIEGMTIAAYAIGASQGYVYIRAEYPLAVKRIKEAIETAKSRGYLGENILGSEFSFDIKIKKGAGAFVCGEETSLIASIEGKRGMPRPRPPFPVQKGIFDKPTVINNVETLANVPYLFREGGESFAKLGTNNSKGTKIFALTGKIKKAGLVEVPMGTTIRDIIFEIGGGILEDKEFKAVQIGGPSGGCIPTQCLDIQIDYESLKEAGAMMGSGGLVVMDETTCMVDVAKFFITFTADESCGKCTPCREGNVRLLEILERITSGDISKEEKIKNFNNIDKLAHVIKDTSLCGLGQTAPNPILSTMRYFMNEYEAHVNEDVCPAGVCSELVNKKAVCEVCDV